MSGSTCYATIARFPLVRFGSDGSVWTLRQKAGSRSAAPLVDWREVKPKTLPRGRCGRSPARFVRLLAEGAARRRGCYVHRLILEAFAGPCPPGMVGCHNDGNPGNNRLENLRWDTPKGNTSDMIAHGTIMRGSRNHQTKITPEIVRRIRRLAKRMTQKSVAAEVGVKPSHVYDILRGHIWAWLPD